MKILILVLSFDSPPYDQLMKAQEETWGSIHDPDIATVFYYGGLDAGTWEAKPLLGFPEKKSYELKTNASDKYYYMAGKLVRALEFVKDWDYDIIFRTNSSSYVSKKRLKEFAKTLPKEKLYAGWEIKTNEGFSIVSGAGFFLSRDTAEILRIAIDPTFEKEEDYYCGSILNHYGIKVIDDKSRYDYPQDIAKREKVHEPYHFRFKTDDRIEDAKNMRRIHKAISLIEKNIPTGVYKEIPSGSEE